MSTLLASFLEERTETQRNYAPSESAREPVTKPKFPDPCPPAAHSSLPDSLSTRGIFSISTHEDLTKRLVL